MVEDPMVCSCPVAMATRYEHCNIDTAVEHWKKVSLGISMRNDGRSKNYLYVAPDGSVFKTLLQIKQYFLYLSGISVGLDYLLNKIALLPEVNLENRVKLADTCLESRRQMETRPLSCLEMFWESCYGAQLNDTEVC